MTAYDEQLYTFITQPENFEPFLDLHDQYEKVRKRVVNEFWIAVLDEAQRIRPANSPWVFLLDSPGTSNRKLRAKHPGITGPSYKAGVIYEHLEGYVQLGAWFDRSLLGNAAMNEIMDDAKRFVESEPTWYPGNESTYFMIHKRPGIHLAERASFLEIAPGNRTKLVTPYAAQFVEAVTLLGDFCLKHALKY